MPLMYDITPTATPRTAQPEQSKRYSPVHILVALVTTSLLVATGASAHNGELAIAAPLQGITIDGDVADWPASCPTYVAKRAEYGADPENSNDLYVTFRVGHVPTERALVVAVEIQDDSFVVDPFAGNAWDTQDGCSVYIDRIHADYGSPVEQYFQCGRDLRAISLNVHGERAEAKLVDVAMTRTDSGRCYEWKIRTEGRLRDRGARSEWILMLPTKTTMEALRGPRGARARKRDITPRTSETFFYSNRTCHWSMSREKPFGKTGSTTVG